MIAFVLLFSTLTQTAIILHLNVNWDEYWFLNRIYLANSGELHDPFQNFHVHLLAWIPLLPINAIDQIITGRIFMLFCEAVSLTCLYFICRQIADRTSALLVVVLWFGSTYSLAHGASFRTDALSAALLMSALAALLANERWWRSLIAGVFAAISLLVTVKGALYLPAFLGALVFVWHRDGAASALRRFAVAGVITTLVGGTLWLWHSGVISDGNTVIQSSLRHDVNVGENAAQKVMGEQEWFPRERYIKIWIKAGIFTVLTIIGGALIAMRNLSQATHRNAAILALLCVTPLLSLAVYRNAFPYFFPFILLPVMIGVLPAARWIIADRRPFAEALLAVTALAIVSQAVRYWPRNQNAQRAYTSHVHHMFPDPVPYVARSAMLPSFPKSGFFMSTLGIENAHSRGNALLAEAIERDAPPLLMVSSPAIVKALMPESTAPAPRLTSTDETALRTNYISHWGDIWVAGKRLDTSSGDFRIVIPGAYSLECEGERYINAEVRYCGSVITLQKGHHRWTGGTATLRWGTHLPVPNHAPPITPIYYSL